MSGVAIVDAGSSSFILSMFYDRRTVKEKVVPLRLGSKLMYGRIPKEVLIEAVRVLNGFKELSVEAGLRGPYVFATGVFREAFNGREALEYLLSSTGCEGRIISPLEEAELSFRSAARDFGWDLAIFDIGGFSVEYFSMKGGKKERWSKTLGAAVIKERFNLTPPFKYQQVESALELLIKELRASVVSERIVVIGSTGVLTAAFLTKTDTFSWDLHGYEIEKAALDAAIEEISESTPEQIESRGVLFLGRGDLFPAGMVILKAIMETTGVSSIVVSAKGFRHEIAQLLMEGNDLDGIRL